MERNFKAGRPHGLTIEKWWASDYSTRKSKTCFGSQKVRNFILPGMQAEKGATRACWKRHSLLRKRDDRGED